MVLLGVEVMREWCATQDDWEQTDWCICSVTAEGIARSAKKAPARQERRLVRWIPAELAGPMDLGVQRETAFLHVGQDAWEAEREMPGKLSVAILLVGDEQTVDAVLVVRLIGDLVGEVDQAFQKVFMVGIGCEWSALFHALLQPQEQLPLCSKLRSADLQAVRLWGIGRCSSARKPLDDTEVA